MRSKKRYFLKRQTPKTAAKNKARREKLSVYYDTLISRCSQSEESGEYISNPSRMNVCHIFPKRRYKSVEDNLENYVFLTAEEHANLDRLLDLNDFETIEKEFKNSWSIICQRAKHLLTLLKESGNLRTKFQNYLNV